VASRPCFDKDLATGAEVEPRDASACRSGTSTWCVVGGSKELAKILSGIVHP
jgi:hypothetical protein